MTPEARRVLDAALADLQARADAASRNANLSGGRQDYYAAALSAAASTAFYESVDVLRDALDQVALSE